jgi:hypothetical protein
MLEELEPLLVQFEQGASETGLTELLEKTLTRRPGEVAVSWTTEQPCCCEIARRK